MEIGLEYYDHVRGYESIVFGALSRIRILGKSEPVQNQSNDIKWGNTDDLLFPFRSRYIEKERRPGIKRIWIMSSSMSEDIYLPPYAIWPNIMDAKLEKEAPGNYEVLNASKVGMNVQGGLIKLKKFYNIYKPDIVIFYDMSNDIIKLSRGIRKEDSSGKMTVSTTTEKSWFSEIIESISIYSKTKNVISTKIVRSMLLNDSLGTQGYNTYIGELKKMIAYCQEKEIKLILCTFPTRVGPSDNNRLINEIVGDLCFKYNHYLSARGWINTIKDLNEQIKLLSENEKVSFIDLEGSLTGKPQFFRDYVHLTPEGHIKVANIIASEILTQSLEKIN